MVNFASLDNPPEDSCTRCEDSDDIDHDSCVEAWEEGRDQARINEAEARREAGDDW